MRHRAGIILAFSIALAAWPARAAEYSIEARDTVSGFELNHGDTVKFKLRNGQVRTLTLEDTSARVLETNLRELRKAQTDGGTLYEIRARVRVDGHVLHLIRYVGAQETFAVPYVVNGMRLWLDAVRDALPLLVDNHGGNPECAMTRQARFAANDVHDAVAPVPLRLWYPMQRPRLDIAESYNGDDPYWGAYQGAECHAGLDINMPRGTPLFAPIDIDDHYLFNSLAAKGDNNNRWRGIHRWPNGDVWTLQAHHVAALTIPEHQPLRAGAYYADAANVLTGTNEHSHFILRTRSPGSTLDLPLDAWILFWQMCEQERKQNGEIRAAMQPLSPARTGAAVRFSGDGSQPGRWGVRFERFWTFGDGGFSLEASPAHAFARPGIYPVTLSVWDGVDRASTTQLMTVDGAPVSAPALALAAPDEIAFVERRPEVRDVYGIPPTFDPAHDYRARRPACSHGARPRGAAREHRRRTSARRRVGRDRVRRPRRLAGSEPHWRAGRAKARHPGEPEGRDARLLRGHGYGAMRRLPRFTAALARGARREDFAPRPGGGGG